VDQSDQDSFRDFVEAVEPRLRRALIASCGFERGREATAEALAWAWEHWETAQSLEHRTAYLFRVGQSKIRSRKVPVTFDRAGTTEPWFEPALAPALAALTERQRVAVVLVHGFDWTLREVAELMEVQVTSVQTHLERGLANLRTALEVPDHA
jgi:DNA-directed RNA polymerase specialized sigma24 family protein